MPIPICEEVRRAAPSQGGPRGAAVSPRATSGRGNGVASRADNRATFATADGVTGRDLRAQLDRHTQTILTRMEELFSAQQENLTRVVMNMQFSIPADQEFSHRDFSSRGFDALHAPLIPNSMMTEVVKRGSSQRTTGHASFATRGSATVTEAEVQTDPVENRATWFLDTAAPCTYEIAMEADDDGDPSSPMDAKEARLKDMQDQTKSVAIAKGNEALQAFVEAEDQAHSGPSVPMPRWQRMVRTERFDMFWGTIIILNALVMMVELEWKGITVGHRLKMNIEEGNWPGALEVFLFCDYVFSILFTIELTLRIGTYKIGFFLNVFNWIDLITVAISIFDLFISPMLSLALPKLSFMRVLRLMKLVKVLRVVRVMRLFHQLRVLVVAIVSSMGALGWSIIFLTMVQATSAILITQVLMEFLLLDSIPLDTRVEAFRYFGRWTMSQLTMYQITLAPGPWGPVGRLLIYQIHPLFVGFFVPYGWMITFAVVRVISAMFLKQTLAAAAGDGEVAIVERMRKKDQDVARLRDIFAAADTDGSGSVNWPEFQAMLECPSVKAWLGMLELDVHDMEMVFNLLDDGDGHVTFDEFISGVMRCRGGARGVDVASLLSSSKQMMEELQGIATQFQKAGAPINKIGAPKYDHDRQSEAQALENEDKMLALVDEDDVEEPGTPFLKHMVHSRKFDIVAGAVVCFNAVVIALELEWRGLAIGAQLGVNSWEEANWPGAATAFLALDHMFCWLFMVELLVRLAADSPRHFLKLKMNWIDIITVVASVVELYVFGFLEVQSDSMALMRLLRLMKLAKILRIMRVVRLFHQLRVLVTSLVATIGALTWSIIFLATVQAIAAIFMTQLNYDYLQDETQDPAVQTEVHEYFGRWTRSMLTMHQITLAPAAWGYIGRVLIFKVSPLYATFFVAFGWGVTFAVVNVISAIFLKQTLAAAAGDGEVAIMERMAKKRKDVEKLRDIFKEGDRDGSGSVDWHEFRNMIKNPRVRAWLGILELDVTDMATVFNLLDDGDGQIEFEEFISGVMKCRGAARGVEVVALIADFRRIQAQVHELRKATRHFGFARHSSSPSPVSGR